MTEMVIDIVRVTEEGNGIGFASDGRTVIIHGVRDEDESVRVKVIEEKEMTIIAKKISSAGAVKKEEPVKQGKKPNNPYELDNGSEEEDDEDYYEDDDR